MCASVGTFFWAVARAKAGESPQSRAKIEIAKESLDKQLKRVFKETDKERESESVKVREGDTGFGLGNNMCKLTR